MKYQGWESDAYRAGLLRARTIIESAIGLGAGLKYILRKIDERAEELEPHKLAKRQENKK